VADSDKKFLKRLSDYDVIPATNHLIEPYVPMGGLVFVCGLPKTFKTYLSGIDWGYSVATGCPWLGRPVRKGRVAYYALEGYHGVLRRAEAWRVFHKHPTRTATDGLAYITDRLSVAAKTCNVDQHFTTLYNAGYRPDLVQIDTWFKVTAGAGVGEQTDMSVALQN
jgi:RecA-family ATPase